MFLPEGVSASTVEFMKREGAEIVTAGKIYLEALRAAEEVVATDPNAYDRTVCSIAVTTANTSTMPAA